jgi:hypothetical protein
MGHVYSVVTEWHRLSGFYGSWLLIGRIGGGLRLSPLTYEDVFFENLN